MSRRTVAFLIILIIAPVAIYLLWPTDESRIRKLFKEGSTAIEQEKIDDLMAKVSFNYADEYGLSYLFIKEGMTRVFKDMDNIKIEYEIKRIELKDKSAVAELEIRVLASRGSDIGYIAGDLSKPLNMKFSLDKDRNTWLVTKSQGLPVNF
jgi:hypothetical protein